MSDSVGDGRTDVADDSFSFMSFGPLDTFLAIPFAAGGIFGGAGSEVVELSLRAVAVVLVLSLVHRIRRIVKSLPLDPSLPTPPLHPLLGIVPYAMERWSDWPAETLRLSRKFGWKTWGGPAPSFGGSPGGWIMISNERNVRHVLSDNFANYVKNPLPGSGGNGVGFKDLYRELLGEGIFAADGDRWVMHRKVASNMFSRNLLRHTARVTLGKLKEIEGLFLDATKSGSSDSSEFDVQDLFYRLTFDTTSLVAFGCEFNSIREKTQHPFTMAFDEMQPLILDRTLDSFFPIKRALRLGRRERRIRTLKTVLDGHAAEFIQSKRRSAADGCELGPDILSRFLAHSEKTGVPMSNEELRDVVMNILIAGRDTTACALSWTFWELSRHPEVVDKILEEVRDVCGAVNVADDYSYDAMSRMRYTHAAVMEALRLHPSVTNDHKYAVKDDMLPDGTHIPAGIGVAYLPFAMGRSEKIWGDDASEFRPERFLEEAEAATAMKRESSGITDGGGRGRSNSGSSAGSWELKKEPSQFRYPVFNAGPRLCLGKPLALTTIKLTLAYLLPRFVFTDKRGHDGSYRWTMVRSMKGGFKVDVSRRGA